MEPGLEKYYSNPNDTVVAIREKANSLVAPLSSGEMDTDTAIKIRNLLALAEEALNQVTQILLDEKANSDKSKQSSVCEVPKQSKTPKGI
jgi:hypothetical protein